MRRLVALALVLSPSLAAAAEGMWTPDQLAEIAAPLKAAGLELDPAALADLRGQPMGALVSLGGCSAAFVSAEGLVVTNHHCARGAIQLNSTPERNLLVDGFHAEALADEPSAGPGARIYVTEAIHDVTDRVLAKVKPGMADRARFDAIDTARKELVAECEARPGYRCNVVSFFGGLSFRQLVQLEIRDVRLVYAPPGAIGSFGGEVDNWMWPRHTGDFAFYRAYVGPDGKPAAHAPENRPYRPQRHLTLAAKPLGEGDFVMVAGYPGSTFRHRLADEIEAVIGWTYPRQIAQMSELLAIVAAAGEPGSEVAIKYVPSVAGWENARKNFTGQLEGFARADALGAKRREEAALEAWLATQGAAGRRGQANLDALRAHLAKARETRERDQHLAAIGATGLFSAARTLHQLSIERQREDARRQSGYQKRDEPAIEARLRQLERRLDPGVDRQLLRYSLLRHAALPQAQRLPELDAWLGLGEAGPAQREAAIDARLERLYANTELSDTATRMGWLAAERGQIEASDDSFLQLAVALSPALQRLEDARKAHEGGLLRLQPAYMQTWLDFRRSQGRATYPDANGTLRITFGNVRGKSPRDGLAYLPFTHASGILAKHTGVDPFDATAAQIQAIEAGAQERVVNFLADLDVTGGNSGSATLNSRGELVGLVFDMTWESVASNWLFDPALTRSIHVDLGYMAWVMEQVYPAPRVLRELGLRGD